MRDLVSCILHVRFYGGFLSSVMVGLSLYFTGGTVFDYLKTDCCLQYAHNAYRGYCDPLLCQVFKKGQTGYL
jgi:hypothetical protein